MCEVPTVEITVPIRFVWVDVLHGGLSEGCNRVGRTPSGPRTGGGRVGGTVGEGGQRGIGRSRNCIAIMRAFLSLPATFAFVGFSFSFALSFCLVFAFDVKSFATTRGGFSGHVPILVKEEILLERKQGCVV